MLLDDVITRLSDESQSITGCLLKTKILLADLDQPSLIRWVNQELNGYGDGDELPDYRVIPAQVRGNLVSMSFRANSHPIPILHLKPEQRKHLEHSEIREGLSVIEALVANSKGSVQRPLAMEFNGLLGKKLAEGVRINSAWVENSTVNLIDISSQVRSRLLDFLLQLRSKVGREVPEAEIKNRAEGFDAAGAFKQAVFYGPTNVHVGSHGTQTIAQEFAVGDRAGFRKALQDVGLPKSELVLLDKAIDADIEKLGKASMEGATGHWYTGLLGKVAKGSVKIGTDVATAVIGAAAMHYTGLAP